MTYNSFLGYASRWYQKPPEFVAPWKGVTLMTKPQGFKRVGDAVCSFNPVYGQGMTVAPSLNLVIHFARLLSYFQLTICPFTYPELRLN